jgi:hypothetical protein
MKRAGISYLQVCSDRWQGISSLEHAEVEVKDALWKLTLTPFLEMCEDY